ncbi:SpaH/EbpB family LPXTG-anchored major pilin [Streptococcus pneumoniae]
MKKYQKLATVGMLSVLLGGVVPPLVQPLTPVYAVDNVSATVPAQTTVTITKLQAAQYKKIIFNDNGETKTLDELKAALDVQDLTTLDGVTFKWYKITDSKTDAELSKMTEQQLDALYNEKGTLTATANGGKTTFTRSKDQYNEGKGYWVIEQSAPQNVSNAYGVPFRLQFPMAASDGSGYLTNVNVYPKNVSATVPTPDKDVENVGQNEGSYNIGDKINFYLKGTIPKNIGDYSTYRFNDTFDSTLDFAGEEGVKEVKFGSNNILTKGAEYTVSWDSAKRTVQVSLTEAGLKRVTTTVPFEKRNNPDATALDTTANTDDTPYLQVKLEASISKDAVVGKPIANKTTITFNNRGGNNGDPKPTPPDGETPPPGEDTPPVPPVTPPEEPPTTPPSPDVYVYTGGKRFVKEDSNNTNKKLAGAEFKIFASNEANASAVKWTQAMIDANAATSTNSAKFGGEVAVGKEIVLKSDADGSFEIKGLAYTPETSTDTKGDGSRKYYLQETKAPAGYVLLTDKIEFEVNQTSYHSAPSGVNVGTQAGDAVQQAVKNNKRPNIPNTGGIGTIIFIVIGLALMTVAMFGMKKDKKESN